MVLDRATISARISRLAELIASAAADPLIVPLAADCRPFADALAYALGCARAGERSSLRGRDVVVAVTALDSGLRLRACLAELAACKAASLRACVLLDRPRRRLARDLPVIASGFVVADVLFAGFGLGGSIAPDLHFADEGECERARRHRDPHSEEHSLYATIA
jgi:hypoxanthine-guanine phosphoribosyltransferase